MTLKLSIGASDCDRIRPLIDGAVTIDGVEARWHVHGVQQLFNEQCTHHTYDAAEFPLATYLRDLEGARRYLALSFPFLPIDRLRITRPDLWAGGSDGSGGDVSGGDGPAIVVEAVRGAMRLAAVDADGLAIGLTRGMTLADARAREPDLRVFDADPHADQDWLERLCDGCARYTPNAAPDGADGLMLDISGCGHLWGGEEALAVEAAARLERHGLRVRHAIAASPQAAHALARFPVPPAPDEDAAVRRLPVEALGLEGESAVALRRAGMRTSAWSGMEPLSGPARWPGRVNSARQRTDCVLCAALYTDGHRIIIAGSVHAISAPR